LKGTKESEYFLKIRITNTNGECPDFNWIRGGNVALGIEVAKQYVKKSIPPEYESKYSAYIKLKAKDDSTAFEWNHRQGNVRLALDTADEFIHQKLGFDLIKQIQKAKS